MFRVFDTTYGNTCSAYQDAVRAYALEPAGSSRVVARRAVDIAYRDLEKAFGAKAAQKALQLSAAALKKALR